MNLLRYIIAGRLQRNFIILPQNEVVLDVPGGSLLYAGVGAAIWENGIGLIGRVGEDYPQTWLEKISSLGFDCLGIRVLPQTLDLRTFIYYSDYETPHLDNPVGHFARLGIPFPKTLLGYTIPSPQMDSRTQSGPLNIRLNEIPEGYLDATAAHLCPLDYINHTLLPSSLRQLGHITTVMVDSSPGYMNPIFWDDMPMIVKDLTAFHTSEEKITNLFQGRSKDLWEMAEALASYGCEIIVIKRHARGQYVYDHTSHSRWILPAYPARVYDTTGAGDAFCGGFLAGYRNTYSALEAALHGNISASLSIEGSDPFYALHALPGLAQARLENLRQSIRKV